LPTPSSIIGLVTTGSPTSETPSPWRPLGSYELGPRLATGGMAELYIARTPPLHGFCKYCAIKRILPRWADDHEFVEMFLDEARLAAHLDHPNVVHVHAVGKDEDGLFFAMDYIHGQNLLAIMRRHRAEGSFMAWDAFAALGSAAAAGLHHAHERRGFDGQPLGIIHRDVSPTNILVTYEGVVKLVDFGIAKASTSRHSTRPSVRKGKIAYMSPEQCRGDALDRRSDVFALGVVLYELATLMRAFTGEGELAVMNQIVNHELPPPSSRRPDVPVELDYILARAVARDPKARYGSARELQQALDEFAVDHALLATPNALAAMMDVLFGASPYPWESMQATPSGEVERSTTQATATTQPTTAEPMRAALEPAAPRATTSRRLLLGGLAMGLFAALAWAVMPRGDAAGTSAPPTAQIAPSAPQSSVADQAAPAPPEPIPTPATASTVDTTPPPDPPTTQDPAPTPPSAEPERRTTKPTRPRTTKATLPSRPPALPEPFDPDAPAPRVR
jgi:eukaryotic-like serine/threonine-protein kinase